MHHIKQNHKTIKSLIEIVKNNSHWAGSDDIIYYWLVKSTRIDCSGFCFLMKRKIIVSDFYLS